MKWCRSWLWLSGWCQGCVSEFRFFASPGQVRPALRVVSIVVEDCESTSMYPICSHGWGSPYSFAATVVYAKGFDELSCLGAVTI
jgi:hypothetical protein